MLLKWRRNDVAALVGFLIHHNALLQGLRRVKHRALASPPTHRTTPQHSCTLAHIFRRLADSSKRCEMWGEGLVGPEHGEQGCVFINPVVAKHRVVATAGSG